MAKEPQRIKLSETPSHKEVKKIPLPPLNKYDVDMVDDIYIKPDNDCIYKPIANENSEQNNS